MCQHWPCQCLVALDVCMCHWYTATLTKQFSCLCLSTRAAHRQRHWLDDVHPSTPFSSRGFSPCGYRGGRGWQLRPQARCCPGVQENMRGAVERAVVYAICLTEKNESANLTTICFTVKGYSCAPSALSPAYPCVIYPSIYIPRYISLVKIVKS